MPKPKALPTAFAAPKIKFPTIKPVTKAKVASLPQAVDLNAKPGKLKMPAVKPPIKRSK